MPRRLSGGGDIYEARRVKTLIRGRTVGSTGVAAVPQPAAQNDMLLANSLPSWAVLTGPAAAEQVLISGASPFTPTWAALFDATVPNVIEPDDPAVTGAAAVAARRDHEHGIVCAVAGVIQCDDSAAEGTATSFARSDHEHGIVCAAPIANLSVSTTNAEGAATSFARSDHGHAVTSSSNPEAAASLVATDASGYLRLVGLGIGAAPGSADLHFGTGIGITHADGVAAGQVLRANGTRYLPDTLDVADLTDLAYATPALSFGTANAAGAASSVIRSDATLALFDATAPTVIQCDDSAAAGTAGAAARRDHEHGIICAAPAANSVSLAASAEGTATSFARSDHAHNLSESITPTWTGAHTFNAGIVMADGTTIGQAAGPLLTFDDTNNYLEVTGCNVGILTTAPGTALTTFGITSIGGSASVATSDEGIRFVRQDYQAIRYHSIYQQHNSGAANNYLQFRIHDGGGDPFTAQTIMMTLLGDGNVVIAPWATASTQMTRGLTINQVTSDDEILCLKSTDVAQPITDFADADTYGAIQKSEAGSGGLSLIGYKDADGAGGWAAILAGRLGEAADTTKSAAGAGVVSLDAAVTDGGTSHEGVGADGNLVVIRTSSATRFIFDAEGEMHSDAIIGVGNDWDEWDDLALAADLSRLPRAKFDEMLRYHAEDFERAGLVTLSTDEDGVRHAFIRHKAMLMFAMCCFGEVHKRLAQLNIKVNNLAISQGAM